MADPKAIVVTGNGTNCEMEMAHACRVAGFEEVDIVYIFDILSGRVSLEDYHFLCLPGGFLDGDDLGAAKAAAVRWRFATTAKGVSLGDQLKQFVKAGKLILGVCNGFQLLVKLGLLPALEGKYYDQTVTLTFNESGRFEDRWVHLAAENRTPCVFLKGITHLYLPVRHGEGKLVVKSEAVLEQIKKKKLGVLRYADAHFNPTDKYPANPNGSVDNLAGLCDESGRIFGLMPHPEAYLHFTNFPRWPRHKAMADEGQGVAIFRNAHQFLKKNL